MMKYRLRCFAFGDRKSHFLFMLPSSKDENIRIFIIFIAVITRDNKVFRILIHNKIYLRNIIICIEENSFSNGYEKISMTLELIRTLIV